VSDDRLAKLAQLREAEDRIVRSLVRDELAATIPALQEIRDQGRADLDAAETALAGPQEEIRHLKAEIAEGEETRAKLAGDISGTFGERVARRAQIVAADQELAELHAALSRASDAANPLLAARDAAKRSYEAAAKEVKDRKTNLAAPFWAAGQFTTAYVNTGWAARGFARCFLLAVSAIPSVRLRLSRWTRCVKSAATAPTSGRMSPPTPPRPANTGTPFTRVMTMLLGLAVPWTRAAPPTPTPSTRSLRRRRRRAGTGRVSRRCSGRLTRRQR
jgi:hypothetical protein